MMKDLVLIFDSAPGIVPVSAEEQLDYYRSWIKSLTPTLAVPRLSIAHLFILTTVVAIKMATLSYAQPFGTENPFGAVSTGIGAVTAIFDSVAITGAIILFRFFLSKTDRRLLQPGHWILLAWAVAAIGSQIMAMTQVLWMPSMGFSTYGDLLFIAIRFAYVFPTVLVYFVAWLVCKTAGRWWTSYFALRGIAFGALDLLSVIAALFSALVLGLPVYQLSSLVYIYVIAYGIVAVAAPIILVVAVVQDRRRVKRDWLHNTAWISLFCWALFSVATVIVFQFAFRKW